MILPAAFDLRN